MLIFISVYVLVYWSRSNPTPLLLIAFQPRVDQNANASKDKENSQWKCAKKIAKKISRQILLLGIWSKARQWWNQTLCWSLTLGLESSLLRDRIVTILRIFTIHHCFHCKLSSQLHRNIFQQHLNQSFQQSCHQYKASGTLSVRRW